MFVALEVVAPKHKGVRGMLERVAGRRPVLEERRVLNTSFGLLHVLEGARGSSWEELAEITGCYAARMLLPDGMSPPPGSRIRALDCAAYDRQVLLRTACESIVRTRMQLYKRMLGLLDPQASYVHWLPELLKYFTAVQVVTEEQEAYLAAGRRMMQEMGAPVLVSASVESFRGCVLVLAPDGAGAAQTGGAPPCPVLAATPALPPGWTAVTALQPPLPQALHACCPQGIAPHRFAGALYAYAGLTTLPLVAQTVRLNGRETEFSAFVALLAEAKNANLVENGK